MGPHYTQCFGVGALTLSTLCALAACNDDKRIVVRGHVAMLEKPIPARDMAACGKDL